MPAGPLVGPMDRGKLAVGIGVGLVLLVFFAFAALVTGFPFLGPVEAAFMLVPLLMLANVVLIVAAVVHALVRDDLGGIQRLVWIALAVLVTPIVALGAIVYFVLGRERTREIFGDIGGRTPRSG